MIAKDFISGNAVRNRRDITRRVSARKAHPPPVTPVTESDIVGQNTPYTGGKAHDKLIMKGKRTNRAADEPAG
jgi:hypothetical protein